MTEIHAYTPSPEFIEAYEANEAKRSAFIDTVVLAWDKANPDTTVAWLVDPLGADRYPCGINDAHPDQPAPEGLSRSQKRKYLIPKAGAAGARYAEQIKACRRGLPSRTAVLEHFGIPPRVEGPMRRDGAFLYAPVVPQKFDGQWFVVCTQAIETTGDKPVLVPAKLSAYHAARERQIDADALAADTRAAAR